MFKVIRYSWTRFPGNCDAEDFSTLEEARKRFQNLQDNDYARLELEQYDSASDEGKTLETWGQEI